MDIPTLIDLPDLGDASLPPLARANNARAQARMARAEMLMRVHNSELDILQAIRNAQQDDTGALGRTRLRLLLMAEPGRGEAKAEAIIRRTSELSNYELATRNDILKVRVSWLFDRRTGGRRLAAFCDAMMPADVRMTAPWTGFPYGVGGTP